MKRLPFFSQIRHYTALVSTFLLNLNIFGVSAKNVCSPGFNCHGCPWATFACPVGVLGYGFGIRSLPAFAIGTVLGTAIFTGRLVCGYVCPFGFFQDILARIPLPKIRMPRFLRYGKYLALAFLVVLLPFIFGFVPSKPFIEVSKPKIDKVKDLAAPAGFPMLGDAGKEACELPPELMAKTGEPAKKPGLLGMLEKTSTGPSTKTAEPPEAKGLPADFFKQSASIDTTSTNKELKDNPFKDIEEKPSEDVAGKIKVQVTVKNLGNEPLQGFELETAYYSKTGEKIWSEEKPQKFDVTLKPGESYSTPVFYVPNKLNDGNIVVSSPQSRVSLDFWPLFCTYCPVATFEADIPVRIAKNGSFSQAFYEITSLNTVRLIITVIFFIGMLLIPRFFCRAACPLGAIYALFARYSLFRIENNQKKCISCSIVGDHCTKCDTDCPVGLDVLREAGGPECIACGNCVKACPKGALSYKFGIK